MSSSKVQVHRSKKRVTKNVIIPVTNYGRISGLAHSAPYSVLSPVLVPYVEAPVQHLNSKTKGTTSRSSSVPAQVRYVSALAYSPCQPVQYVHRNSAIPIQYCYQAPNSGAAYLLPQSLPSIAHGYVSAIPAHNGSYIIPTSGSSPIIQSDLNPLSRPYTPPSRLKPCTCGKNDKEATGCAKHRKSPISGCSTPEPWSDDLTNDDASKGGTPSIRACPYCRRKDSSSLSDTDSGVEGESDDENWCACYKELYNRSECNSPCPSSKDEEEDYPDLRLTKDDQEKVSEDTSRMIDFVCSHLDSHEWRTVARELGVCDVIIQSVEYDVYDSFREQMKFVFSYWARSQEALSDDERARLVEKALSEIGRMDLIVKLKQKQKDEQDV